MEKAADNLKKDKLAWIIQDMILNGEILPQEKLPPEHDLSERFCVFRSVVHDALLQLQTKDLTVMRPRHGCVVNDFFSSTSISLLTELYKCNRLFSFKKIKAKFMEFRQLILVKTIKKITVKIKNLLPKERTGFFCNIENGAWFSGTENKKILNENKIIENKLKFITILKSRKQKKAIKETGGSLEKHRFFKVFFILYLRRNFNFTRNIPKRNMKFL